MLVYVVNDGWYETPPEPQQHASRVIYRAIETRRPVIRCANTGISLVIDKELGLGSYFYYAQDYQIRQKVVGLLV